MKNKTYLDAFISKCISKFNGRYCVEEISTGGVSNYIVSLPTCYFVMNDAQYNYFFKRVFKSF